MECARKKNDVIPVSPPRCHDFHLLAVRKAGFALPAISQAHRPAVEAAHRRGRRKGRKKSRRVAVIAMDLVASVRNVCRALSKHMKGSALAERPRQRRNAPHASRNYGKNSETTDPASLQLDSKSQRLLRREASPPACRGGLAFSLVIHCSTSRAPLGDRSSAAGVGRSRCRRGDTACRRMRGSSAENEVG